MISKCSMTLILSGKSIVYILINIFLSAKSLFENQITTLLPPARSCFIRSAIFSFTSSRVPVSSITLYKYLMPFACALFYLMSCYRFHTFFLTTQCKRIPFRISNFSTVNPTCLQHSVISSLVAIFTSPCPHRFASGSSILSMNHRTILFSLVTSRSTSLPPRTKAPFYTFEKCQWVRIMMKTVGTDDRIKRVILKWKILTVPDCKFCIGNIFLFCLFDHCWCQVKSCVMAVRVFFCQQ